VKAHPNVLWQEIRLVEFRPGQGSSVRGLANYREATHLIDDYLNEVHERWLPVIKNWQ